MNNETVMRIGGVKLRVASLPGALHFYGQLLGFQEIANKERIVYLSANGREPYLISLEEIEKEAPDRRSDTAGLYHIAIRYPGRKELARAFLKLYGEGVKFQGFSDHLVSEAIYLVDPEGNGIELYADKPRDEWQWVNGEIEMSTEPLDIEALAREAEGSSDDDKLYSIDHGTDIGHIHLRVTDLRKAERFYHDIIGFDVTARSYPGALFFSSGGYHHYIGANVWGSRNGKPAREEATGLDNFSINISGGKKMDEVIERLKDSRIEFEDSRNGIITRDFDRIKVELKNEP